MEDLTLFLGLAAAPVIAALVQVVKPFIGDERLWPVVAIGLGIGWNLAVTFAIEQASDGLFAAGLIGVVAGLAASGLYSAGKTVTERRGQSSSA